MSQLKSLETLGANVSAHKSELENALKLTLTLGLLTSIYSSYSNIYTLLHPLYFKDQCLCMLLSLPGCCDHLVALIPADSFSTCLLNFCTFVSPSAINIHPPLGVLCQYLPTENLFLLLFPILTYDLSPVLNHAGP